MLSYFTKRIKDKGYTVLHTFPVLYQGWETDEWAAVVEKDSTIYLVTTDHGSLKFDDGVEALEYVHDLIKKYDTALRDTKLALEYLPNA